MSYRALDRLVPDADKFRTDPPTEAAVWRLPDESLAAVLDLDTVDTLVAEGNLRAATLSVVEGGRRQPASAYTWGGRPVQPGFADVVRPQQLAALLDRKATLVLETVNRTHRGVGDLCRALSADLGLPVGANAYLTPAAAQGFTHHYDTHDVLIVQTHGSKTWQLSPPIVEDPSEGQPFRESMVTDEHRRRWREPALETVLRPGDVLWVPRGWIHNGFATGEPSLHLSLGLPPLTPHWVATELVKRLDADPRFRRTLPFGFATDPALRDTVVTDVAALLRDALAAIDTGETAAALADTYRRYFLEPVRNPVSAALGEPVTTVRTVPESVCGTDRLPDGRLRLHLGDTALTLDAATAGALVPRLTDDRPWRAADLGVADADELVAALLRSGVVRRA